MFLLGKIKWKQKIFQELSWTCNNGPQWKNSICWSQNSAQGVNRPCPGSQSVRPSFHCPPFKHLWDDWNQITYISTHGSGERQIVRMVWVTRPRWLPCLYLVTTLLKYFFSGTIEPMAIGLGVQYCEKRSIIPNLMTLCWSWPSLLQD